MTVNILTALLILLRAVNAESNPSLLTTENSSRVSYIEDVLKANMYSSQRNEIVLTSQFSDTIEMLEETFRKNDYTLGLYDNNNNPCIISNIKTVRGHYYVKCEGNYVHELKPGVAALKMLDDDNIFGNWSIQDSLDINADNGYLRIGRKLISTNPIYKKYRVVSHFNGKLYFIGYDGYNNATNKLFAIDLSNVHNDEVNNSIILGETVKLNFEPHFIVLDQFNGNIFISSKHEVFILEKLHYYEDFERLRNPYFMFIFNKQLEETIFRGSKLYLSGFRLFEED